jgi:hypothetical protein
MSLGNLEIWGLVLKFEVVSFLVIIYTLPIVLFIYWFLVLWVYFPFNCITCYVFS